MSQEERARRGARDRLRPPASPEHRAELQRQIDRFTEDAEFWLDKARKPGLKPMQAVQLLNAGVRLLAESNKLRERLDRLSPPKRRAPEERTENGDGDRYTRPRD